MACRLIGKYQHFEESWYLPTSLHSVTTWNNDIVIFTAVRTSNLTVFTYSSHVVPNVNCIIFSFSDLNIKDHAGNTPLHVAVGNESVEAVDYLLQRSVAEK
jgi:ankyrin repeat protein